MTQTTKVRTLRTLGDVIEHPSEIDSELAWWKTLSAERPFDRLEQLVGDRHFSRSAFLRAANQYYKQDPSLAVCPVCNGQVVIDDSTYGQMYCLCYLLEVIGERVKTLAPWRSAMRDYTSLENYQTEFHGNPLITEVVSRQLIKAYSIAEKFLEDPFGHWLVISGNYGTGKSHLTEGIAKALGPAMSFFMFDGDWNKIATEAYKAGRLQQVLSAIQTVPVWIIDDFGTKFETPYVETAMLQVFNYRYQLRLPTVITSNIPLAQLSQYDPRLGSRFMENGFVYRIQLASVPDMRSALSSKKG